MKKLLIIPTLIFPYLLLFCMYCIFSGFLMDLFDGFILVMILYVLGFLILACICNIIYIALCHKDGTLLKTSMIVKIAQVPAYIAIFILGVLFMTTIFTIGFTLFFIIYDIISVFLSGMIGLGGMALKKGKRPVFIVLGLLQTVMVIDLPISIVTYLLYKNSPSTLLNTEVSASYQESPKKYHFKPNILSTVGLTLFLTATVVSEVLFANVDELSALPLWLKIWMGLSFAAIIGGTIVACVLKNRSNTLIAELVFEAISTLIGFAVIVFGFIAEESLALRIIFCVGTFLLFTGLSFGVSTLVGLTKKSKKTYFVE